MAWIAGVAAAGASAYGAYQAGQNQPNDKLANAQADIAKGQWSRYKSMFLPMEDRAIAEANMPVERQGTYLNALDQLESGFGAQEAAQRRAEAAGTPAGGAASAYRKADLDLLRTKSRANLLVSSEQDRKNRLLQLMGLGRGLPAQASSGLASADASLFRNWQAAQQTQAQAGAAAGQTMGNLLQMYMLTQAGKDSTAGHQDDPYVGSSGGVDYYAK